MIKLRISEDNFPDIDNSFAENQYIYRGLKSLIEIGSGWGFHSADLGHPAYRLGASDASEETLKVWEYADSPKRSLLFQMISTLSKELKQSGIEDFQFIWWYDFSEWRDFCKFVIDVFDKKRGSPWENGYNESFHGKFRDELLNDEIFESLFEAKVLIERWRKEYNTLRPHSTLGYLPPAPETVEAKQTISATLQPSV